MTHKKDYENIKKLYLSGLSGKEIANIYGCKHSNSIRQLLRKHGDLRTQSAASLLAFKKGKKEKSIAGLILASKTTNRFNPKKSNKGEKHPNWIKDRSKVKEIRGITEERSFFKEVMSERGFICELTGQKGTLSVHHIKGVWSHKELRYDKKNCIVILRSIHLKFHKIYGNRTNESDWKEFVDRKEYTEFFKTFKKRNFVPFDDKTGREYGRLKVLFKNGKLWRCKCVCGNETDVSSSNLKFGKTKSCGCLMREINRADLFERKIWELSPASKKGTTKNRKYGSLQK